jgi:hypothetical protein
MEKVPHKEGDTVARMSLGEFVRRERVKALAQHAAEKMRQAKGNAESV